MYIVLGKREREKKQQQKRMKERRRKPDLRPNIRLVRTKAEQEQVAAPAPDLGSHFLSGVEKNCSRIKSQSRSICRKDGLWCQDFSAWNYFRAHAVFFFVLPHSCKY